MDDSRVLERSRMKASTGIVYVATGEKYIERALYSASSLKTHSPDCRMTIFCDQKIDNSIFEQVEFIKPKRAHLNKIIHIAHSPYDYTLFVDADTYICADISGLFDLLNRFDIAVAHDTYRLYVKEYEKVKHEIHKIPDSFPMLNSGVILFKKSPRIERFFEDWLTTYEQYLELAEHGGGDQPAFRKALYNSALRLAILPPEYNCRFVTPVYLNGPVKILHGPHKDLPGVARELNRSVDCRVFLPELGTISTDTHVVVINSWHLASLRTKIRRSLSSIKRYALQLSRSFKRLA